jgi:hypothetical protein
MRAATTSRTTCEAHCPLAPRASQQLPALAAVREASRVGRTAARLLAASTTSRAIYRCSRRSVARTWPNNRPESGECRSREDTNAGAPASPRIHPGLGRRCGVITAAGLPGAARAASWATIDAQVQAHERNHPGRPWAGTLVGPEEMTGDLMVAAMDAVGVDGACWSRRSRCTVTTRATSSKCSPSARTGSAWSSRSIRTILPSPTSSPTGRRRRVRSASGSSCTTMSRPIRPTPASTGCRRRRRSTRWR